MIVYIAGFTSGIIPVSSLTDTGILTVTSVFGMLVVVTNIGTMVDLNSFLKEWKTVLICICGLLVLGVVFLTVGSLIFDMQHALAAYPPIAGGIVAVMLVAKHCNEIGQPMLASFAWFLVTLQMFIGIPVASFSLKIYCYKFVKTEEFKNFVPVETDASIKSFRLIPPIPEKYNSPNIVLAKVLVVTCLSSYLGIVTPISAAIYCLMLGVLTCEIGFLDRYALQKSGMLNLIMFCMLASAPNSFATLSMSDLLSMVMPVVAFLLMGGAALVVGGFIAAKYLKVPVTLAIPISINAMFGFPFNIMITEDVVRAMNLNEEDTTKLKAIVLPKMTIAGFTSVTVMSVVIAGIVVPFIR